MLVYWVTMTLSNALATAGSVAWATSPLVPLSVRIFAAVETGILVFLRQKEAYVECQVSVRHPLGQLPRPEPAAKPD